MTQPGDLLLTTDGGLFVVEGVPQNGSVPCSKGDVAGIRHPIDVPEEHIRSIFAGSELAPREPK